MKSRASLFSFGFFLVTGPLCAAQTQPAGAHAKIVPSVRAFRVTSPIALDGRLDEAAWNSAQPATGFKQYDPDEGKPETEKTEIRVLYDDQALYIGARMYDREPKKIRKGLSRRDDSDINADWISIYLDPRHDHLTGAHFQVTSAGSLSDSVIYNDTWEDSSWDAVWDAKVTVDDQGWVAEIRIPFSFANPDFNFKSLRVNAIFRWEWRLGSTLYLVWTQERQDNSHPGDFTLGRDVSSLFQAHPDNVFAVKLAYWLTR